MTGILSICQHHKSLNKNLITLLQLDGIYSHKQCFIALHNTETKYLITPPIFLANFTLFLPLSTFFDNCPNLCLFLFLQMRAKNRERLRFPFPTISKRQMLSNFIWLKLKRKKQVSHFDNIFFEQNKNTKKSRRTCLDLPDIKDTLLEHDK